MANMEDILDRLELLENEVTSYKMKVVRLERKVEESQVKILDLEMKEKTRTTTTSPKTCIDSCATCKTEIRDLRREIEVLRREQLDAAESRAKVRKLQTLLNSFIMKELKDPKVQQENQSLKSLKSLKSPKSLESLQSLKMDDLIDVNVRSISVSSPKTARKEVKPELPPRNVSPRFESLRCSKMQVDHKTGIITDLLTAGKTSPMSSFSDSSCTVDKARTPTIFGQKVGQFISAQPLNARCPSFSLEIINPGTRTSVGIGICTDDYPDYQHPGWEPGSIGYHADDGGIFIEKGSPRFNYATCKVGDIMGCKIGVDSNTVSFFRNHVKVYTHKVGFPVTRLHAIVGLHYGKVAVKLLEREPWRR